MATIAHKVSYLTVTEASGAGQRIDNYLVKTLKNIPKSKIYSILRKGEVRVNKGRIKPSYKLQADDIVRLPPLLQDETTKPIITDAAIERINIEKAVLYEDDNFLIVNKPSGLAVHGGSGVSFGLIEMLRKIRPQIASSLELIHRIDRDTSGCVMIAKNPAMLRAMHAMFKNKQITKTYHLLVKGYAHDTFTVRDALKKYTLASGERLVSAHPEGQAAETHFKVLARYNGSTLLQANPVTGRTHQIRVHAAIRNLPIIGDQKYGDKAYNQIVRKLGLKRLFLHAYALDFVCPLTKTKLHIQASYAADWQDGLKELGNERQRQLGTENP